MAEPFSPRLTDALNLRLVKAVGRFVGWGGEWASVHFKEAIGPEGTPENVYLYLYALAGTWLLLVPVFGVLMAAVGFLADKADGSQGSTIVLVFGTFAIVFCIAGSADATWRFWLAQAARRRYRREGGRLDDRTRRLLTLSRVNDRTLILQVAIAALFAWRVA